MSRRARAVVSPHARALALVASAFCWLVVALAQPTSARADVVDDAYAAGSEAATAGDWSGAIEHWREALELLPGRSAQLDYDLGTAYAHVGELGRATYHFERALQAEARPSVEVAEAARRNLGIVRRRAEVQADVNEARISREPTTWDRLIVVLAGRALGWFSLACAWLLLALVIARRWQARREAEGLREQTRRGISGALVIVFALVFVIGGSLHALAIGAAAQQPNAIALDTVVEAREGPGAHLPVSFTIQGGSRVRVVDQRSGWRRVRLPGGLEGWAPANAIARLRDAPGRPAAGPRTSVRANEAKADTP